MINKIVYYKIKKGSLQKVKTAIDEFVHEIAEKENSTNYCSYQKARDETTFIHIMSYSTKEDEESHLNAEHTKKFVDILYPECVEEPVIEDLNMISSVKVLKQKS
ncbi:MAG: antibiotic biosynthesis monooxygenase [Ignavibacteria bacterium]|jgi:quinol monooxygenase YgiN